LQLSGIVDRRCIIIFLYAEQMVLIVVVLADGGVDQRRVGTTGGLIEQHLHNFSLTQPLSRSALTFVFAPYLVPSPPQNAHILRQNLYY
jgi:hypothetical protein